MEKIGEKSEKREHPGTKNLTPGGPGRPKGSKNFSTLFRQAIKKIAEEEGIDPEAFEVKMVEQAIKKGFNGQYNFYKDVMDRVHGQAQKHIDHTTDGMPIQANTIVFTDFTDEADGK